MGLAYFLVRKPWQLTDNLGNMQALLEHSLRDLLKAHFGGGPYFRPFLWGSFKIVFDAADGHYLAVFTVVEVLQVGVLLVLFARLLAVRTRVDFVAAIVAFSVLVGGHTFGGFVIEIYPINAFLTVAICVLLVVNLAESRGGWVCDAAAPVVLAIAVLTVESGLLVWVALVAAYLVGARGVSPRGVIASTVVVILYFWIRFGLLGGGTPGVEERSSGFGFHVLDPPELVARFATRPGIFYAHNVAAALGMLLFAEPRMGVWELTRGFVTERHDVMPWMLINVCSSTILSLLILVYSLRKAQHWIRFTVSANDRPIVVFWAVAAANAVISYGYTKDQIMTVAACMYAVAAAMVLRAVFSRLPRRGPVLRSIAVLGLLVLTSGWAIRTAGLHYNISVAASRHRNDWLGLETWLRDHPGAAQNPKVVALARALQREVLAMPVPTPFLVYRRLGDSYFDQH
ncbi:MAG: hypothetical protein AB1806_18110 [Acidobacteriota bacterium]